jgi:hypothetical protein
LASVLRGHYAYYGLSNCHRLGTFYYEVCRLCYRVLSRRSQRWLAWSRFKQLLERFLCLALVALTPAWWSLAESIKPQEEPSAGNPHARIREGKSRMAALLDLISH